MAINGRPPISGGTSGYEHSRPLPPTPLRQSHESGPAAKIPLLRLADRRAAAGIEKEGLRRKTITVSANWAQGSPLRRQFFFLFVGNDEHDPLLDLQVEDVSFFAALAPSVSAHALEGESMGKKKAGGGIYIGGKEERWDAPVTDRLWRNFMEGEEEAMGGQKEMNLKPRCR
ncbi:hypothetical protein AXF42_Ash011485 [Apostasia shenzhenica]|uniref:Uncharacterized protein n=1 Tax=Apostasia shenzhenica TaxID=1088818 RepID=A0A2I0BAQ9_9ASPA|nr:hypothetical protein AXF42_Ash011485 [Apostasia shenzhenica]